MWSLWLVSLWSGERCGSSCVVEMSLGEMTRESLNLDGVGDAEL
jgi:hypothetical protein